MSVVLTALIVSILVVESNEINVASGLNDKLSEIASLLGSENALEGIVKVTVRSAVNVFSVSAAPTVGPLFWLIVSINVNEAWSVIFDAKS